MLLALLLPFLPCSSSAFAQESVAQAVQTYQGPHCSFPVPEGLSSREYGTGWGVVAEVFSMRKDEEGLPPLFRVTSIFSSEEAANLAGQLLDLDRQDIAQSSWAMASTSESVTRKIAGAERAGTRIALSRPNGAPATATYILYAWSENGSINLVRTVSSSDEHQALIDLCLDGVAVTGIHEDTVRKVGPEDYGFLIPANWQGSSQELQQNFRLCNLAFPSGGVEALIAPKNGMVDFERDRNKSLSDSTSRLISMSLDHQGEYLGKRRSWLNVEGRMVEGRIHRWKDSGGLEVDIANYAFKPDGINRLVQMQLMQNPGLDGNLLAEVTRTTRHSMYRNNALDLPEEKLSIPGISIPLPRGMSAMEPLGDAFADGVGAVLGKADDGGPRWFFWSIPGAVDQAQLPQLQEEWLKKWLDRDFPGTEILKQQTMDVEVPLDGTYQGAAWTVRHTRANKPENLDWMRSPTRDWMCAVVAIPFSDRTLLGIMQVDDRDKFPMLDDFRHSISRALSSDRLHATAKDFDLELPADGPWSFLHQPGDTKEEFVFLHKFGKVRAILTHYTPEGIEKDGVSPWASHEWTRKQVIQIQSNGGEILREEDYGLCRVGNFTSYYDFYSHKTKEGDSRSASVAGWREKDTQVIWTASGHSYDGSFERDLEFLSPTGAANVDFSASALSFGGLRLPNPGAFGWQEKGGFSHRKLHLTYHAVSGVPLTLEFLMDPGEDVSNADLLQSLLPEAPEWNPMGALSTVEVETQLFGKSVMGLRRTGLPVDGVARHQEVYVDRQQGILRVLRFDGPALIYSAAEPVLQDLFAELRLEDANYVMDCSQADSAEVVTRQVGPLNLALPPEHSESKTSAGGGEWKWNGSVGVQPISVISYGPKEQVLTTMSGLIANADAGAEGDESLLDEGTPFAPHSFLAIVDGVVCKGAALRIEGVATFLVTVTHNGENYVVMAQNINADTARTLLRNALTATKLEVK